MVIQKTRLPIFTSNYPGQRRGQITLLPTPERVGALPEYTGKGVTIAFLDAGYYAHPDIRDRIVVHVDATTKDIVESDRVPKSELFSWHGQMTSVICAGDGSRSDGRFRGIASSSNLVLIKISDPQFRVKEKDIERGLKWVKANHKRYNIDIVNLSVGGDHVSYDPYHPLHRLVKELSEAGVTVVAASGNSNLNHVVPPASAADAITVGGLDDNNTLDRHEWTLYTHNVGMGYDGSQKPDVVAPARWIASPILPATRVALEAFWLGPLLEDNPDHPIRRLLHDGKADIGLERLFGMGFGEDAYDVMQTHIFQHKLVNAYYQHVDGTSVAAPIVTAVCAQVLEANPDLSPFQVRSVIMQTALKLDHLDDERQGHGVINPAVAVGKALALRNP